MPTEFRPPPSINPHCQQGVAADLLDPLLELFRRRAEAGFGHEDISGIFELIWRHDSKRHEFDDGTTTAMAIA
ncbi:hypothetical protein GWC77_04350 [Paraburkholderia sp. NMBU_R16]|uniref:hypothetical protein n=1 Tax=Paraburkholderia sp. NMBU_R16 TaxID=2698676 RepID=UPI0015636279|nr:hypothetical protein [Paraburkholderia sp. NMBU_R16]NRO95168.1 hypothetical protein [Paraburkholderia sp. NMBU_R16]